MKVVKTILKVIGGLLAFIIVIGILAPVEDEPEITPQEPQATSVAVVEQEDDMVAEEEVLPRLESETQGIDTQRNEQSITPTVKEESIAPEQKDTKAQPNTYNVSQVVDGDTIHIDLDGVKTTVRLIGVDTPETVHPSKPVECMGIEASNYTKSNLSGKSVTIETDASQGERDKYGRLLAYVFIDGANFNKALISNGYAYEYTYNAPYKYQDQFKAAQESARINKRGLWADGVCDSHNTQPEQTQTNLPATTGSSSGKWYTSSHYSAKYYYCEESDGWRGLSVRYLRTYESESELIADFPDHKLHQDCA